MPLQECGLNLNRVSMELQPHGSAEFPCAGYSSSHTDRPEDAIPWHWHEEMELVYISRGRMDVKTPGKSFTLGQGELAAINSNTLHFASAAPECELHSLVFSPALITGGVQSVFARKYIQPLISSAFSGYKFSGEDARQAAVWFSAAFDALAQDSPGFEFIVRESLSRICLLLYERLAPKPSDPAGAAGRDGLRMRKMLDYIHGSFNGNVSVSDIAAAASISERECIRCFHKSLGVSPIQYLIKYRVMQGAKMLLEEPSSSISETAAYCGFDSPSNFSKMFRRFYGRTPREYRSSAQPDQG